MIQANRVELTGCIAARGALRHTPAGVPVLELALSHESEITEAGVLRKVSIEVPAIAFESQARLLSGTASDRPVRVGGFLASKSRRSKKLVLHIVTIEFIEGA